MARVLTVPRCWLGRRLLVAVVALAAALPLGVFGVGSVAAASSGVTYAFTSWDTREDIQPQPVCAGNVGYAKSTLRRQDCGWGRVTLSPAASKPVKVEFIDNDGADGSGAVQEQGSGGNAALAGSPTWTSAPIDVTGGQTYGLTASVKASGLSSAPSVGLVYLSSTGQVLDTVKVLTAPLTTSGFAAVEKAVPIPPGVARVRVTKSAFAPTDLPTAGTVTFDDIGLFEH